MAQITKKTNKKGETVYQIRVSCGYDYKGRQRTKSMTYKPKAKSPKQIEKEVQKQAILFEQQCSNPIRAAVLGATHTTEDQIRRPCG